MVRTPVYMSRSDIGWVIALVLDRDMIFAQQEKYPVLNISSSVASIPQSLNPTYSQSSHSPYSRELLRKGCHSYAPSVKLPLELGDKQLPTAMVSMPA